MKLRKGMLAMLIMLGMLSFFGCKKPDGPMYEGSNGLGKKAKVNESGLASFVYSYDGTIGGNGYRYEIVKEKDGRTVFNYDAMQYRDLGVMSLEIDEKILEQLNDLYVKHNVCQWEGFNKYSKYISDGWGFFLSLSFNDGKSMSAHGSNCSPDGYGDFMSEVNALVAPLIEKTLENKKNEFIEEGLEGDLSYLYLNILQKGTYGSDSYEITLRPENDSRENFSVNINSVSGEFLPAGKYSCSEFLNDEVIDLAYIKSLMEKYEVIKWYGFDKAAEDYMNAEWFQCVFEFDNVSIRAYGTAHPDNYDEFRKELLTHIVKILKSIEKDVPIY